MKVAKINQEIVKRWKENLLREANERAAQIEAEMADGRSPDLDLCFLCYEKVQYLLADHIDQAEECLAKVTGLVELLPADDSLRIYGSLASELLVLIRDARINVEDASKRQFIKARGKGEKENGSC